MALSKKRELFVIEYLIDFNGSAAAIRAGYSPHSARQIAHKLLQLPEVQERIQELLDEKMMDANEALISISELARNAGKDSDKLRALELMVKVLQLATEKIDAKVEFLVRYEDVDEIVEDK